MKEKMNEAIAWFQGYVQAKAESFAHGVGVSPDLLTEGLGRVVQSSRQRVSNRVPDMPETPTKINRKLLSKATVDSRASSGGPRSVKSIRTRSKQRAFWQKKFPTKAARSAEMSRRRAVAQAKKEGK